MPALLPAPALLTPLPAWQAVLALLPALLLALGAVAAFATPRADAAWRLAQRAAALALAAAAAALAGAAVAGAGTTYGLRADLTGGIVATLVGFVGWVVVRYSQRYLAGAAGERNHAGWLLATLAAVMLVIASNHLLVLALAWSATSLGLHRLLTFFGDRAAARLAAHKKFVLGRVADLCMLGAAALLASAFGTLQIDALLARAAAAPALPAAAQAAVWLIVVAALLKCAQLPFHGWLIQVMEAPTPVSALLHAGIVNLGGFVLIRLAPLVAEVPAAGALLVAAGTATAVVAALVATTRVSIKVALAWSTCAQMGFMLMQCALGLWPMALLHLVAHSLYKAHAFLSAGGVVRATGVRRLAPAAAPAGAALVLAGTAAGVLMVAAAGFALGHGAATPPALWVGAAIFALALTPLAQPPAAGGGRAAWVAWVRTAAAAFALAALYFALHAAFAALAAAAAIAGLAAPAAFADLAAPAAPPTDTAWWLLPALAFTALFALQTAIAASPQGALSRRLYPWCYGGLFLDEIFSRALLRLWPLRSAAAPAAST